MGVVDASFDQTMKHEEKASAPLAGGIMMNGYQCGMLWGAALAAGAQAYRRLGASPQAETMAVMTAQKLVKTFRSQNRNEINCLEITNLHWKGNNNALPLLKFIFKGGPIGCFNMTAKYAPGAFDDITAAIRENPVEVPSPPVSCASMLARKMGASDMHAVMAAGFAGGIGLSGSGCGALGAAIWIIGLEADEEYKGIKMYENPRALAAVERFLESADFEFECSNIVGRKFTDVSDHAGYLQAGGCANILEALADESVKP